MKKILILAIIIFLFFFFTIIKVNSIALKDINFNLDDDQLGVTIIDNKNNRNLLIHLNNHEFTIKLDEPNLFISDISNDNIITLSELENSFIYKNMSVFLDIDRVVINFKNKNLCVVSNSNFNDCDYIYLLDSKENTLIPEDIELVIYDKNIKEETILNNYSNWVDSIELKDNYYTTLIIDGIQYHTTRIPKKSINF